MDLCTEGCLGGLVEENELCDLLNRDQTNIALTAGGDLDSTVESLLTS